MKALEPKALAKELWDSGAITDSGREQLEVLLEALKIHEDRQKQYQDHWKRYGAKGAMFNLRQSAERAWHSLWGKGNPRDDLLDAINYAAFTYRACNHGNNDGDGSWW